MNSTGDFYVAAWPPGDGSPRLLLGPYPTAEEAGAHVGQGRRAHRQLNRAAYGYRYGVARAQPAAAAPPSEPEGEGGALSPHLGAEFAHAGSGARCVVTRLTPYAVWWREVRAGGLRGPAESAGREEFRRGHLGRWVKHRDLGRERRDTPS